MNAICRYSGLSNDATMSTRGRSRSSLYEQPVAHLNVSNTYSSENITKEVVHAYAL